MFSCTGVYYRSALADWLATEMLLVLTAVLVVVVCPPPSHSIAPVAGSRARCLAALVVLLHDHFPVKYLPPLTEHVEIQLGEHWPAGGNLNLPFSI